jgi:CRISPR-associated exonuclease Cas4
MTFTIILIASFFVIGLGLILLFFVSRSKRSLGVLTQEVTYRDTEKEPGKTMYAKTLPLVGKPDYLVRDQGIVIPVEVKTGKTPSFPYDNHTMQLMAYCLLVEENLGVRPPGGYLKYPDKEFKIKYTPEAEQSVRDLVAEITRAKESGTEPHCSHPQHNL